MLQGCNQARLTICTNRHQCMGGHCQTPKYTAASVKAGVSKAEANARVQATCMRAARKEHATSARDCTRHVCTTCNRDCHSRIRLHSHKDPAQIPSTNHRLFEMRMPLLLCTCKHGCDITRILIGYGVVRHVACVASVSV